jgi:flagellin
VSVEDVETANRAIVTIDEALKYVNKQRADLGAVQNRMEMASKGINIASENMTSSESIIRDTDVATETVNFVKNEILQSVSSSMLSQALYTNKDNVLKLLS